MDLAFMEGGVAAESQRDKTVMLASIRYEAVWIFHRGDATLTRLDALRLRRLAIGRPGNGGQLIVEPLLEAINVTPSNAEWLPLEGTEALRGLQSGGVDAAILSALPRRRSSGRHCTMNRSG